MSKGRHRARERQARKYFPGGTMPDGLELFPLDGGKLEIVQELFTASEDEAIDDDDLGHGITKLYASRYDDVKDLDILALQASIARSPKTTARRKEGSDHSDTPLISGPDFPSDTQDTTLTPSPASKSSRSSSQKDTRTDKKEIPSSGPTATVSRSKQPASVSSA